MKNSELEKWVKSINKVLKSKKSKLSPEDREQLIITKQQIQNAKSNFDLIKPLTVLAKLAGIAYAGYEAVDKFKT